MSVFVLHDRKKIVAMPYGLDENEGAVEDQRDRSRKDKL